MPLHRVLTSVANSEAPYCFIAIFVAFPVKSTGSHFSIGAGTKSFIPLRTSVFRLTRLLFNAQITGQFAELLVDLLAIEASESPAFAVT